VSSCPLVMFHNNTSGQCQSCPLFCDECSADESLNFLNCDHCINGYNILTIDNVSVCVQFCPSGYYAGK
jgi:hypothetical protein